MVSSSGWIEIFLARASVMHKENRETFEKVRERYSPEAREALHNNMYALVANTSDLELDTIARNLGMVTLEDIEKDAKGDNKC